MSQSALPQQQEVAKPIQSGIRTFILQRSIQAVLVLLGVLTLVFVLARLTGDPALVMLPPDATAATIENFRRIHGLDKPLIVQYQRFLLGALKGDFGQSLQFRTPAVALVLERMPATFQLAGAAWLFAIVIGIPTGILAAANRNAIFDNLAKTVALLGQAVPAFWLGIMLIMLFAVRWRVLPSSGSGGIGYLILPAVCLAAGSSAVLIRLTRSSVLEEMTKDYLRTARAKGLTQRVVIVRHALNNALIPILTIMGLQLTGLLSGAVVVETVFAWPGIGLLAVQSISFRDYPVVLATVFAAGCVYILGNIVIDVLYAVVDPRVRYG